MEWESRLAEAVQNNDYDTALRQAFIGLRLRHGLTEDRVQDTVIVFAKKLQEGLKPANPAAYLYGITRKITRVGVVRDEKQATREALSTDGSDVTANVAGSIPDPENAALKVEFFEAVKDCMKVLTSAQRSAIETLVEGPEGPAPGRVLVARHAARRRLTQCLKTKGFLRS